MATTSRRSRRPDRTYHLVLVGALCLLMLLSIVGLWGFFHVWQKGDEKAQAFSGLLAFIASFISSIATVVYVYLTNASLRKAQASITLQQEELEQMKSSVDLQRREWEQKVRVFPQFWITTAGATVWHKPHPQYPTGPQVQPLQFNKHFIVNVWNYSEQSFLVESIRIQRSDVGMVPNQQTKEVQIVVKPHSVGEDDVSHLVMPVLTQSMAVRSPGLMTNDLDKSARLFVRLVYSDWSQKHSETEIREFEFVYRPGDADVSIRAPLSPSGIFPSI